MTLERLAGQANNTKDIRRLLEVAFAQTRMAMCVTDPREPDNPIIAINHAFTQLTGYEETDILGRNCRFLQGENTDGAEVQRIRACIEERTVDYFELLNYRKDGTPFWNALHVGPVFSDEGELLYFFGSQWDVTEKVEALRALEGEVRLRDERLQGAIDEVRRLSDAIDQAKDAMLLTEYAPIDEPGPRIVWASAGFERMTGYSREEIVGRSPRMFQGPLSTRADLDRIRAALERGEAIPDAHTVNYKKDGTPFHLEWSIAPVAGGDGMPRYWLSVQRNVTERVETQRKLELLARELAHRNKNIIALITALQRMLPTEGRSAADYQADLERRLEALVSAQDAVFASPGEGATIEALARSVLAAYPAERIALAGPEIVLDAKAATNLALVLHELATNAAKHGALSAEGGEVALSWRREGEDLFFDWLESGGPPVTTPTRRGFGQRLLRMVGTSPARLDAGPEYHPDGLRFRGAMMLE